MYDIIGDVHGHAPLLKKLLTELGYIKTETGYIHPERKAIFVGDFINRGPQIRKTIRIIRAMVENGNAFAILGNHEINAINYYLKFKKEDPQVKSPRKYFMALFKTLNDFTKNAEELTGHLKWLRTLPLFLEFENIRVVHACWSQESIDYIKKELPEGKVKKSIYRDVMKNPGSEISKHISILTRGIDFIMPGDMRIVNNKGVSPRTFRLRWWEQPLGKTFEEMSFESKFVLPSYTIPQQILPKTFVYSEDSPIVFFGHYCRFKGPYIVSPNICCVDSCVNGSKKLLAYKWNGEKTLKPENLIFVEE